MATPASAKKTKVSSCGLCDAKIAVKWKCKDCDKYLCENCKVQHQRNKATKKHVILEKKKGKPKTENKDSFPDLLNGNPAGTDSTNDQEDIAYAFCTKHTDNLMQWFCNSCCLQVCKICISIEHEAHVIAEVASVLKKREKKITKYFKYVSENFLKDALERRKKSKELKVDFDNSLISIKRDIWIRYDDFMLRLGKQRDELMKQLDDIQKAEEVKFIRSTETIEREVSTLESIVNSLQDMIDDVRSGRVAGDEIDELRSALHNIKRREPPNPPKVTFKAPDVNDSMINTMYGKVESKTLRSASKLKTIDTDSPRSTPGLEITVLSSFSTDLPFVKSLCPINESEAWIACWQTDEIQKITSVGNKNSMYRLTAMDLARNGNGDVMIATYSQCVIKCLRSDGVLSDLKSTSPLYPTGIYVSENDDFYVSLVDRYDLKIDGSSVRRLVKMDNMCNTKLTIECDQHGAPLFTYPAKVTLNVNNDICIVDETGQYSGRLVVVDQRGDLKFIYGEIDPVSHEKCDLSSCACDEDGRILVTDWLHHKIHVVSKEGYFMGYLMSKEDGIYFPFSLGFFSDGSLWIGCKLSGEGDHGDVVRIKYKF